MELGIKKLNRSNKFALIAIVTFSVFTLVLQFYTIRFTSSKTDCFPYKAWFIVKRDRDVHVGDFIVFKTPPKSMYVPAHKTWIKKVLAGEGTTISVNPAKPGETAPIITNGVEIQLPVRAYVTIENNQIKETFRAFAVDSLRRPMPIMNSQTIPAGHYYAYSPVARSYDSRYWGLLSKDEILGKAYPLF